MSLPSTFSYYGKKEGQVIRSDVRDTYEHGSSQLKARTLSRFQILASLQRFEWHEKYFKILSGPCDGLGEIRFKADNVQQRPLGFHLSESEFVVLYWAREKGDKFVPKRLAKLLSDEKPSS